MGDHSAIEWTDATWNPVTGCTKVSAGCDHCYAERLALRLQRIGLQRYRNGFAVTLQPAALQMPLHWRKPRRIFVNSMSDLFHGAIPKEFIDEVFRVMEKANWHQFQILTKRPGRMAAYLTGFAGTEDRLVRVPAYSGRTPSSNVWIGTSVENAETMYRIDLLRRVPAAVRFLSLEPLLGPLPGLDLRKINWVIVGGESGQGHRPIDPAWVRDIRRRCRDAHVPFFFKQWGGRTPKSGGRLLDGRTYDEMPRIGRATVAPRRAAS
jgi:protein gp37